MIVTVIANFMATNPDKTKLTFLLAADNKPDEPRHAGYISLPNDDADHFLTKGMGFNTGYAAEHGEHEQDIEGDTFKLAERRGRSVDGRPRA